MAAISGKVMKLSTGNTVVKLTRFDENLKVQKLDVTNSTSSGNGEYIAGISDGDVSFTIIYMLADTPYAVFDPKSASNPYTVTFFPVGATTASNTTGSLFVETFQIKSEIRGVVTADVTGSFTGGYTANAI